MLLPFLLWNILNFACNYSLLLSHDWFKNIFLGDASPHFWYIFMLMFWAVLAPLLYFVYKDKRLLVLLFLVQVAYLMYKGNDILHSRFIYMIYTWSGLLGYYYPEMLSKIESLAGLRKGIIGGGAWILYVSIYWVYTNFEIEQRFLWWIIAVRAISLLVGAMCLPPLKIGSKTNYNYSFWVFAAHYWLDVRISPIIYQLIPITPVYQLITWILVVAIGLGSGMIVNRFIPTAFNLLNGNRNSVKRSNPGRAA